MSKPTILIVDDDSDFLESTSAALSSLDRFKILTAGSSDEAFKLIRKKKIDLLVVDYLLGRNSQYNGDGIIRIIRDEEQRGGYKSFMPCILITGSEGEDEMSHEVANLKINYIKKSIRMADKLVNMIDKCLSEKKVGLFNARDLIAEPSPRRSPWSSGTFYLFAFLIIITAIAVLSKIVSPWTLPIVLISSILIISIVGGLQLRYDEKLKDESFLKLMLEALKRLPLLSRISKDGPAI